jgi:hypothetical protein
MNKYGINYAITFAGFIEVQAMSLDDLFEKFDGFDEKELLDNCTDLVEVEPYRIDQYDSN